MADVLVRSVAGVATGTDGEAIKLDALNSQKWYTYTHIAARDVTNSVTRLDLVVYSGASSILIRAGVPGGAARTVEHSCDITVKGNQQIGARFWGATAADVLELVAYGYECKKPPE